MNKLQRLELLKDFIQEAVDRGASSVEEIHQYIAALPFEAFEKAGLLKADTLGLRSLSSRAIGVVYGAIRRINREVGQLISDQFENIEETREVSKLLSEHAAPAGAAARSTDNVAPDVETGTSSAARKKGRATARKATSKASAKKTAAKAPAKKRTATKKSAAKKPKARSKAS